MDTTYYHDMVQLSSEWDEIRCGMITASGISKLLTAKHAIANNETSRRYIDEKTIERIYKFGDPTFQTYDMERGLTEEVYAKILYNENNKEKAHDCGFVVRSFNGFDLGYSPDGLVGDDGLIEIKSRKNKFQIETIIEDEVPCEYMIQIQTGLLVTGRKWCDFVSYSNGMPMFTKRVFPDQEIQTIIIDALISAEEKIENRIKEYKEKIKGLPVAERTDHFTGDIIKPS